MSYLLSSCMQRFVVVLCPLVLSSCFVSWWYKERSMGSTVRHQTWHGGWWVHRCLFHQPCDVSISRWCSVCCSSVSYRGAQVRARGSSSWLSYHYVFDGMPPALVMFIAVLMCPKRWWVSLKGRNTSSTVALRGTFPLMDVGDCSSSPFLKRSISLEVPDGWF